VRDGEERELRNERKEGEGWGGREKEKKALRK